MRERARAIPSHRSDIRTAPSQSNCPRDGTRPGEFLRVPGVVESEGHHQGQEIHPLEEAQPHDGEERVGDLLHQPTA
jgi:hypothetical protein